MPRPITALVVAAGLVVAATTTGCDDQRTSTAGTTTEAERPRETLPPGTTLRVGVAPDLLPALAAELLVGALRYQGATVTTVALERTADAEAALGERIDVAIVVTPDIAALRDTASQRGWVVLDEVPGDLGGTAVAVVTAEASRELGDLLEATIGAVAASIEPATLPRLAAAVVDEGRPTAEVVEGYLVDAGLVAERDP